MQPVQENLQMLSSERVAEYVRGHEGLSLMPYYCTAHKLSIGIGRNLEDRGISREEAFMLFGNDLRLACQDLLRIFGEEWNNLPDNVQLAFIDMMFQLGLPRFSGFEKMIKYAKAGNWKETARELMDSKYAKQDVPDRAKQNEELVLSCVPKED